MAAPSPHKGAWTYSAARSCKLPKFQSLDEDVLSGVIGPIVIFALPTPISPLFARAGEYGSCFKPDVMLGYRVFNCGGLVLLLMFVKRLPDPEIPLVLEGIVYFAAAGLGPFRAAFSLPSAFKDLAILRTQCGESASGGCSLADRRLEPAFSWGCSSNVDSSMVR